MVVVCGLLALVPAAVLAAVVLALEHQRAGRADGDAVAAVDARGVGQRVGELGGDAGVEPAPGDGDGERVLPVGAAALDALVTEDALRVVAHVELVVDLRRLVHGGGVAPVGGLVVAGAQAVALAGLERRRRRAVALGIGAVLLDPARDVGHHRQVDRRGEELEHHLAAVVHALRVRLDLHAVLDLARARRRQDAGALELDDAHPAGVDGRERPLPAHRRDLDALLLGDLEDRLILLGLDGLAVELELDGARRRSGPRPAHR